MRKLLTILALTFAMLCQAQHMKFMGIPIDGTINQFTQKLATKGIKIHPENAKKSGIDNRYFYGKFMNRQAVFWVWYNPKTKIVYDVKVILYGHYEETKQMYDNVKTIVNEKYKISKIQKGELVDGTETEMFTICDDNGKFIGFISLAKESEYGDYWLSIFYSDAINNIKNSKTEYDDI